MVLQVQKKIRDYQVVTNCLIEKLESKAAKESLTIFLPGITAHGIVVIQNGTTRLRICFVR